MIFLLHLCVDVLAFARHPVSPKGFRLRQGYGGQAGAAASNTYD
jgi:hypothetical protein